MRAEQLDIGIIEGEIPEEHSPFLNISKYAEDELVLILPVSHPFSSLPFINKDDLYRLRFITINKEYSNLQETVEQNLKINGIDSNYFKIEMELDSVEAVKNAVQAGFGAAFLSLSAIGQELELGVVHWAKIDGVDLKQTLYIVTNRERTNSTITELLKTELFNIFISYRPQDGRITDGV